MYQVFTLTSTAFPLGDGTEVVPGSACRRPHISHTPTGLVLVFLKVHFEHSQPLLSSLSVSPRGEPRVAFDAFGLWTPPAREGEALALRFPFAGPSPRPLVFGLT